SCSTSPAPQEDTVTADDDGYRYNLDHVSMEIPAGRVNSSFDELAAFGVFTGDGALSTTAPLVCVTEESTYVLHRVPEEVVAAGRDAISAYKGTLRELLVYRNADFSAEPEVVTLDAPDGTGKFHASLSVDEDSGEIAVFAYCDGVSRLQRYAPDGTFLRQREYDLPDGAFAHRIDIAGDDIYFMTNIDTDSIARSYYYDLWIWRGDADEPEKIAESTYGGFTANGVLYYVTGEETVNGDRSDYEILVRYDAGTGEKSEETKFIHTAMTWFDESAYDPETGRIYQGFSYEAHAVTPEPYERVQFAEGSDTFVCVQSASHGILVTVHDYQRVVLYRIPDEPVSVFDGLETLNFCRLAKPSDAAQSDQLDSAGDAFRILRANGYKMKAATAYASDDAEEYAFTMAKKLLAGDTDFDVFTVTTELSSLLKPGYLEDLSQYSVLDMSYELLLPGVREICSLDGVPVLVPQHLVTAQLCWDASVSSAEFEMPSTFAELMNLHTHPVSDGAYFMTTAVLHNLMYPWFEQVISNYMAGGGSDDVLYADLLTLFEAGAAFLKDPAVLIGYEASREPALVKSNGLLGMLNGFAEGENETAAPLVPVREGYKQTVSGEFLAINPNSPNKEAAAVYLAACIHTGYRTAEAMEASFYNVPLTDTNGGNGKSVRVWRDQLTDAVRSYEFPGFRMYLYDWFKKIERGTASPEEAARAAEQSVKMAKYE
ncbi:MAG: extracellular solute-binding protein, partial [Clostridia bacterium]|nr:extracellular solute-binding protein [Clostridia bacterium]